MPDPEKDSAYTTFCCPTRLCWPRYTTSRLSLKMPS